MVVGTDTVVLIDDDPDALVQVSTYVELRVIPLWA